MSERPQIRSNNCAIAFKFQAKFRKNHDIIENYAYLARRKELGHLGDNRNLGTSDFQQLTDSDRQRGLEHK